MMPICPTCSANLEPKEGIRKLCTQVGNPEIAIIETNNPHFCNNCSEYFLDTTELISAIKQVKELRTKDKQEISKGIYT